MLASKLKAGALAGTAVLVLGAVAGLQFTGPASGAGGPPTKEVAKDVAKAAPARPDPPPARLAAEYEPFQGDWVVVRADNGGSTGADTLGIDTNWKFTGSALSTGSELKEDAGEPFAVDARAKPPTIDFTLTRFAQGGTGRLVGESFQGIFRFDANGDLTIAYRIKDRAALRPTRFATAPNSGVTLILLRRAEAMAEPVPLSVDVAVPERHPPKSQVGAAAGALIGAAVKNADTSKKDADVGKVVGAWELVDVDGQTPDAVAAKLDAKPHPMGGDRSKQRWEALRRLQLLPAAGPMDLGNQPGAASYVAYVDLDATRNPKWFTMHATEAVPPMGGSGASTRPVRLCGIYKLDGDKLVVCLPEAEGSPLLRPTDFSGDGEGGLYLLTYQRPTKNWKPDIRITPPAAGPASVDLPMATGPAGASLAPGISEAGGPPVGIAPIGPLAPPAGVPLPTVAPAPADATGPIPPVAGDRPPSVSLPAAPDPAPPRAEVPATDLDRLQGAWVLTQTDGKAPGPDERPVALEFLKDRMLIGDGHARVRLDETKSPRQITITVARDNEPPTTGIYKIEGDRLTIATCKSPKVVPLGFEPDADVGISVTMYERPKVPPPAPSTPRDAPKADPPPKPPARDLQKEVDQLREQLRRLEKELKDRKD